LVNEKFNAHRALAYRQERVNELKILLNRINEFISQCRSAITKSEYNNFAFQVKDSLKKIGVRKSQIETLDGEPSYNSFIANQFNRLISKVFILIVEHLRELLEDEK
jgi:hypothetical protein